MTQGNEEYNEPTQGPGSVIAGGPGLGPGSVIAGLHGAIPAANSSAGPALAAFDNRLHMTWKGVEGDQHVYHASFDRSGWEN